MKARALWAEFVGTFALIFVGMLAIATDIMHRGEVLDAMKKVSGGKLANVLATQVQIQGDIGRLGIALAHGFTIAVFVSAAMAISGGHLNPAVTFGMWLSKRITLKRMFGYWVVQFAGAIFAALIVHALLPQEGVLQNMGQSTAEYSVPAIAQSIKDATLDENNKYAVVSGIETFKLYGIFIEAILTFFLMYVVLGTAGDRRAHKVGGLFIGLTVTLDILAGGPLTGAAMNPARWLGPAFLRSGLPFESGVVGPSAYGDWIVYLIGPMIGAALAAFVYGRLPEEQEVLGTEAELRGGILPR